MRSPRLKMRWPKIAPGWVQAAIEGIVVGAMLGLIDVHSKAGDWLYVIAAYLIAGFILGLRHAGRAWPAWLPLGYCFYQAHLVAISLGYRPPYVEEDAGAAGNCLIVLFPAGLGLALGAFVRFLVYCFVQTMPSSQTGTLPDQPGTGDRAIPPAQEDTGGAPSRPPTAPPAGWLPRRRLTVWRLMVSIAVVGIHLAGARALFINDPFFGFSTYYSEQYSESRFKTLRVGMTCEEVEAIVGQPLRKNLWNQDTGPPDREAWTYSDRPSETANYWRRQVFFEKAKVVSILNDFWVD